MAGPLSHASMTQQAVAPVCNAAPASWAPKGRCRRRSLLDACVQQCAGAYPCHRRINLLHRRSPSTPPRPVQRWLPRRPTCTARCTQVAWALMRRRCGGSTRSHHPPCWPCSASGWQGVRRSPLRPACGLTRLPAPPRSSLSSGPFLSVAANRPVLPAARRPLLLCGPAVRRRARRGARGVRLLEGRGSGAAGMFGAAAHRLRRAFSRRNRPPCPARPCLSPLATLAAPSPLSVCVSLSPPRCWAATRTAARRRTRCARAPRR